MHSIGQIGRKEEIRKKARRLRDSLSISDIHSKSSVIESKLWRLIQERQLKSVMFYIAIGSSVRTQDCIVRAIDNGLAVPGSTFVSTDSHANIMGAIGAFGQGMGDVDIAHAWAHGRVWFKVPPSVKVIFTGTPSPSATASATSAGWGRLAWG